MRYFADENVPALVAEGLRSDGHDVDWGCEAGHGAADADRMRKACDEDRIIITEGNDFAELVMRRAGLVHGLIRFDLHGLGRIARAARILEGINTISSNAIGGMHVIEPGRIRSRALIRP
jgi:Domain of unknown function (DUF5615)